MARDPTRLGRRAPPGSVAIRDGQRVNAARVVRIASACESTVLFTNCRMTARQACHIEVRSNPGKPQCRGLFQLIGVLKLNSLAGLPLPSLQRGAFRGHLADRPLPAVSLLPSVEEPGCGTVLPDFMPRIRHSPNRSPAKPEIRPSAGRARLPRPNAALRAPEFAGAWYARAISRALATPAYTQYPYQVPQKARQHASP